MRIDGIGRAGTLQTAGAPRRPGAAAFSLTLGQPATEASGTRAAPSVTGLDSMLALQAAEDPVVKRRRGARRGRSMLDSLDRMKVALLGGGESPRDLEDLRRLLDEPRESTGDAGLDGVLQEIDLRVAVEIAKRTKVRVP